MSQPKRYTIECVHAGTRREDPNGLWCAYADYAVLQADFTQMTAWGRGLEHELRLAKEANAVLEAKVEWLRKADRFVVWNGTEWQVRHELDGKTIAVK